GQRGNFPDAHRNLGNALARLGELERAGESLNRAMAQGDTSADAHHDLGLILYGRGELDAAVREFRQALELRDGSDAEAHGNLGRALYEMGALAEARSEFEIAIAQREGTNTQSRGTARMGITTQEFGHEDDTRPMSDAGTRTLSEDDMRALLAA